MTTCTGLRTCLADEDHRPWCPYAVPDTFPSPEPPLWVILLIVALVVVAMIGVVLLVAT